uniref:Calneuron 1 n=1 Tax=Oryctolagus cuniculus TaxID=9986 RepID=A0A5F9CMM4_RABIT
MPFHHVTAGLLYKGNYLNRSLSAGSDSEQLANISVEELDEIREAFRVLDRDGNGFISKQELGMAMRSLGYMPSEVELAIIMQRLDMDGDGQVDFDEFMTILGPKLVSSEGRDGFLGNTIDSIFWQFDMQRITLEELKHILYHAFRDHLTMKDIENIIINEEESLNETSGNCQTEFEGGWNQGGTSASAHTEESFILTEKYNIRYLYHCREFVMLNFQKKICFELLSRRLKKKKKGVQIFYS